MAVLGYLVMGFRADQDRYAVDFRADVFVRAVWREDQHISCIWGRDFRAGFQQISEHAQSVNQITPLRGICVGHDDQLPSTVARSAGSAL
jgi:hypothetical protein